MKIKAYALGLALISAACTRPVNFENRDVELSGGWKIQSSELVCGNGDDISEGSVDVSGWYDASVPTTVLGALTASGLYADAFKGTNYYDVIDRSAFAKPWWFVKSFKLPKGCGQNIRLELDGISYRAEIWLNGRQIASSDEAVGPFRQFSFDVTDVVEENNTLAVKVFRAQPGEFNIGFVDWNPRAADESMGIFRPVRLHISDEVAMSSSCVRSSFEGNDFSRAALCVQTTLCNNTPAEVEGTLNIFLEGRKASIPVKLGACERKTVSLDGNDAALLNVRNPRLWWSHEIGKPEMYHMDLSFEVEGRVSDFEGVDFGIRKIETYMTEDGHRGFVLNGRKVLVKGAGWTDDIFLRNPDSRNDLELEYVKAMNMNTVRFENFWGTSQNIYDLCDRKGLLALAGWSCFWEWEVYSGTPDDQYGCIKEEDDMDLIAESLRDQILWLRNHPSIIAWYVGSDKLPRPELEKRYMEFLPQVDDRPVICAAKGLVSELSGPTGMKMVGPYDYVGPEYWYNPGAPGGAFGFNTETGIGAQIPEKESILKMIPENELWPVGKAYDFHCTVAGEAMNSLDVLKESVEKRYGSPADLDDFLKKAHHQDYDGTRAMFEAFRASVPASTGVIQWMLNSAWPSLYWQTYDWYLVPTAAFWSVRKACAPQQLVYNYYDRKVYAVSDTPVRGKLTACAELYDMDGRKVFSRDTTVSFSDASSPMSSQLFDIPSVEPLSFLFLELKGNRGRVVADNSYCISATADKHDWEHSTWIRTNLSQHSDFGHLAKLKKVELQTEVTIGEDDITVEIRNAGQTVAFFVRVVLKDNDGEIIVPVTWDDNYISLRPGEIRRVSCRKPSQDRGDVHVELSGWNI